MTHENSINSNFSFHNSFIATQPHSFVYVLSINAFILHQQSGWKKEDMRTEKPKIFTEFANPCSR